MTEKEIKERLEFLNNPANSHKCSICPENEGFSHTYEAVLPCGQYHCWVDCHCRNR